MSDNSSNSSFKALLQEASKGKPDAQNCVGDYYYYGIAVEQSYEEAVKWYKKAAEQGHSDAQSKLGDCFFDGNGVEQSFDEAEKWYRKASDVGNASAQDAIGLFYHYDRNYEEAIKMFQKAANSGNAPAQYHLGNYYYQGKGTKQDYKKAIEWYRKAAEQGISLAQDALGDCYFYGKGVEQKYSEAVKWYAKAAERGYADSQNKLGNCYLEGYGIEEDLVKAFSFFSKAADQDSIEALKNLGMCYLEGFGVEANEDKAFEYYHKAAMNGDAEAQEMIGLFFWSGTVFKQNHSSAFYWFSKAAEQGYSDAQEMLGECYYCGLGVEQDYIEAVNWYRKAAEQGQADAQNALGDCYYLGDGVAEDYTEAAKWYLLAAEQDQIEAQKSLGDCFFYGDGVSKNYEEATIWYKRAATKGNAAAQDCLGMCYSLGLGVVVDFEESDKWFRESAEQGFGEAQYHLGISLEGKGEFEEAANWYTKAAEQGNGFARYQLGICYLNGRGVVKNESKALELLEQSADIDNSEAQEAVFNIYVGKENYKEASELCKRYAEQGNVKFQKVLAGYVLLRASNLELLIQLSSEGKVEEYYDGRRLLDEVSNVNKEKSNTEIDVIKVLGWMKDAANHGDSEALALVCWFFLQGVAGAENKSEALVWYQKAAEQGDTDMAAIVGNCYMEGEGAEKDETKAFEWYKKAAEQGDLDAEAQIAACYINGEGVEEDKAKGFEKAIEVANKGSLFGAFLAGCLLMSDDSVKQDQDTAFSYLIKTLKEGEELPLRILCCTMGAILLLGCNNENLFNKAESALIEAEKNKISSAELFLCFLRSRKANFNQAKSLLELCEKHKKDSGGWAYFFLSLFYDSETNTEFKDLVDQDNLKEYILLRKAVDCGFYEFDGMFDKYTVDRESIPDYDIADAYFDYKGKIDLVKIDKALSLALETVRKNLGQATSNFYSRMIGERTVTDYSFKYFTNWNPEESPAFSQKLTTHLKKAGITRKSSSNYRNYNSLSQGNGRVRRFSVMENDEGDTFDEEENVPDKDASFLDNVVLANKIENLVKEVDDKLNDSRLLKNNPASGTYILASTLYKILDKVNKNVFSEEDIVRILGETSRFGYDLRPLFEMIDERNGKIPNDKEICHLIHANGGYSGKEESLYVKYSQVRTLMEPAIEEAFKNVFGKSYVLNDGK